MFGRNWFLLRLYVVIALTGLTAPALADNVVITYSAAGNTAPSFAAICAGSGVCAYGQENFSTWTGSSVFNSTFTDSGTGTYNQPTGVTFNGAYSAGTGTTTGSGGEWNSHPQDQYGGVNGGNYPELFGPTASQVTNKGTAPTATYNLALSSVGVPGANYFGIWISALDAYNNLVVYDGTNVVATFNSSILLAQLGACPGSPANAFCGNPTSQFSGQDSGELFVYINIFDLTGYITSVSFANSGSTGFESTNDAVAYVSNIHPVGTQVPEPGALGLFAVGLLGLATVRRKLSLPVAALAGGRGMSRLVNFQWHPLWASISHRSHLPPPAARA